MMKHICLLLTLICLSVSAYAREPRTVDFAVVEGDTLRMDVYMPDDTAASRPAVIFAFGEAFRGGARNDSQYIPFLNFLADNGIVAISTDYRTSLTKNPGLLNSPEGLIGAFTGAVTDAVSDFLAATGYVIANADDFGIDPNKIIASGSSAGAITALQAEYTLCNGGAALLPDGFGYAGVISFAGAILSPGGLTWMERPCPMQLYHGDSDHNVPFATLSVGPASFCGSRTIAESLAAIAVPCEMFTFCGVDHRISVSPMADKLYEILGFIRRIDAGSESLSIESRIHRPGEDATPAPAITLDDIIKANL